MTSIAVLMSTYNGEKYLHSQIESIMKQKGVQVLLYIRDDGSTDKTLDIIKNYCTKYPIRLISGNNIGVGNSFMELMYSIPSEYSYYCFSDQDDVWAEDKLYNAMLKLTLEKGPCLYASNQMLVDKNLCPIGLRYTDSPDYSYNQIICKNYLSGCTMVWNSELHALLTDDSRRPKSSLLQNRIHDVWVAMVAATAGKIIYDANAYIYYRQHEDNVVGAKKSTFKDFIKEKINKIKNCNSRCGRSRLCQEIINGYSDLLCEKEDTLRLLAFYKNSLMGKRKLLQKYHLIQPYSKEPFCSFFIKVMFGLF